MGTIAAATPGIGSARDQAATARSTTGEQLMRKLSVLLASCLLVLSFTANARGGSHSSGSSAHYSGSHHTTSHGGHYFGGSGSSHRGGSYRNTRTGNHYGKHGR
ncbi:hypothetical protein GCM10009429_25730 [Dyella marensis]|jgi:uncharacterized membrane protein YgcG